MENSGNSLECDQRDSPYDQQALQTQPDDRCQPEPGHH